MDNKPTRSHNSQVRALRPLVVGQRWFTLVTFLQKTKLNTGNSSVNSPESIRMKNQYGDSCTFNTTLKAWWFISHISSLEKLKKLIEIVLNYIIIKKKVCQSVKIAFHFFYKLYCSQKNLDFNNKNHVNWFSFWKLTKLDSMWFTVY